MGVLSAAGRELRLGVMMAVASVVEGEGGASSEDAPGLAEEADEPCGLSAAQLVEATGASSEKGQTSLVVVEIFFQRQLGRVGYWRYQRMTVEKHTD